MKRLQGALAGTVVTMLMLSGGTAIAKGNTRERAKNDHVLHDGDNATYQEYFKQEGNGDKNYLFTTDTEVDAPPPGKCLIVTGDSEQWGAVACNPIPK